MKNILIVGSKSSSAAKKLFDDYKDSYNFIRLSRSEEDTDIIGFNVLNPDTYYKTEIICLMD